ncbi:MAG: hypothetical protein E4H26_00715 [Flavobacteriales bacterium]|nr:MAG: hypothetical protein E4H26_00715 [Flavobacteriales bacterium]
MKLRKKLFVLLFFASLFVSKAQEIPVSYELGENYGDRYKFSTVLSVHAAPGGETVLVRTYYGGMPLHPRGHLIEVYDAELRLKTEYNYKYAGEHMVDAFVRNGQLYLLELAYNLAAGAYEYKVHQSPLHELSFTERTLLAIPSKPVANPLAVNKYNRSFGDGFSTTVFFDEGQEAFVIAVHLKEGKEEKYWVHLFGTDLKKHLTHDFSEAIAEKNYAFENIAVAKDFQSVYMMGKAYFKKRRFNAEERRFQYELVRIDQNTHLFQEFNDPGKFPEALKPLIVQDGLVAVGFYADRKDNRYNGLAYYRLDPGSLTLLSKKYNAFSNQFMMDKFGREVDAEVKNLIFKEVFVTPNNDILFSAEEYFVTLGEDISGGATKKVERFHYNDIVCAKLDKSGDMIWARNINKTEITQGDEAYASYSAYNKGGNLYFFINSGENPQQMGKDRIIFKQGFSRNPNMFVIKLDGNGDLSYRKLIDDKEVRLPIMVSRPTILKSDDALLFYAKRGSKKQLVKVSVN